MENRKNTILLTVIAVATLLVAVVGATFAYFTAQGGGSATTNVNVTTSTSSNSSFQLGASLLLNANQDNFDTLESKHETDTQTGTVSWTPAGGAAGDDLNFCYSVNLNVTTNTFEYIDEEVRNEAQTAGTTIDQSWDNTPELVFTISKNSSEIKTGITGLNYESVDTSKTGTRPAVSGWDITEWGSTGATSVVIPDGSTQWHQITSTAGSAKTDNWSTTVTLINLNVDQQHNTNKSFVGTLVFAQVDCEDGSPIE